VTLPCRILAPLSAIACIALTSFPAASQVRIAAQGDGGFVLGVTSWAEMPFKSVVRQRYDYSCGSAALATLLTFHYQRPTSEAEAFRLMYASGDQAKIQQLGFSMLDMKRFIQSIGMTAEGYRLGPAELQALNTPAIALIQMGRYRHFVVIKGVRQNQVLIGDPALGVRAIPLKDFLRMWNGVAFAITGQQASRFNVSADWTLREHAPLGLGLPPLSADVLTRELAPLYQITPLIATGSPAPGG
jgi:predicted double-glycine peptidase